jgi:type III pantothenate kinase
MILAIDIGNTTITLGHFENNEWISFWRIPTNKGITEDSFAAQYFSLCNANNIKLDLKKTICCSVVPTMNDVIVRFHAKYIKHPPMFLESDCIKDIVIDYQPPSAVGADRLANAIAAKKLYRLPAIVVDFGTATTLDAIGKGGEYLGGSILPGIELSMEALFSKTAKLPKVDISLPERAIGKNTNMSIRSGLVLGYSGAIDTLIRKFKQEIGSDATVVATGGLGETFLSVCSELESYNAFLTLEGLRFYLEDLT